MEGETIKFEQTPEDSSDAKREQSTIGFPYLDLDAGVEVARAIYNRSGLGACDLDELAAEMSQVISGAFRLKTGTAKMFDLTTKEGKSSVKLSELGRQIVAAETQRAARAEAFLRVPLYAAVYDKYKGHMLPPPKALEREMLSLGVSSKQTDKARQAFERSAKQAGYFEAGEDRLVRPRAELPTKKVGEGGDDSQNDADKGKGGNGNGGGNGGNKDPLIVGLIDRLPVAGTAWTDDERAAWLRLANTIFDVIYTGGGGKVSVTTNTNTATGQ